MEKSKKEQSKEYLETLEKLRPMDNDFMRVLFQHDVPLAEFVLRIILGKDDLQITRWDARYLLKQLIGADFICLDVFAKDSNGVKYEIEVHSCEDAASTKQHRFYPNLSDYVSPESRGEDGKLPVAYVIYITETDIFGKGRPIYSFGYREMKTGDCLDDEGHIVFVNCAYDNADDDSDIAKLIHDLRCSDDADMKLPTLAEKVHYYKKEEEGVNYMCQIMESLAAKSRAEGKLEAVIGLMKSSKMSLEQAMTAIKLSDEDKDFCRKYYKGRRKKK